MGGQAGFKGEALLTGKGLECRLARRKPQASVASLALGCSSESSVVWRGIGKHIDPGLTSAGRWWRAGGGGGAGPALVGAWLTFRTDEFQVEEHLELGYRVQTTFTCITSSPLPSSGIIEARPWSLLEEFYLPGYTG